MNTLTPSSFPCGDELLITLRADLSAQDVASRATGIRSVLPFLTDIDVAGRLRPALRGALADTSPDVRLAAAEALAGIGAGALSAESERLVLAAMNDPSAAVRAATVRSIDQWPPSPRVLLALIAAAARDPESAVRAVAVDTLRWQPATAKVALVACTDASADVRRAAVALLRTGAAADDVSPARAADLLRDPAPAVRREAVRLFSHRLSTCEPPWPNLLGEVIGDDDAEVRRLVLTCVDAAAAGSSAVEWSPDVRRAATIAAARSAQTTRTWVPYLLQIDTIRRASGAAGADLAARHGADKHTAAAYFTASLDDADPAVRWNAGLGLGECGPDAAAAVPKLAALLDDNDAALRVAAAAGLLSAGAAGAAAIDALVRHLTDDSPEVRQLCAMALGGMSTAAAPAADALRRRVAVEQRDEVCQAAIAALDAIQRPT